MWLQGGGVCHNLQDCIDRSQGTLGSSTSYASSIDAPKGMLSADPSINPDLHTWNRVYVPYCSGDLWTGTRRNATNPFPQQGAWRGYFHGHYILEDIAAALTASGAAAATQAVLSGCSAGGIGTIVNCDWFASLFAGTGAHVGCRPEAGWLSLIHISEPTRPY